MVGGKVVGIARREGSTLLHVQDTRSTSQCSVRVVEKCRSNDQEVHVQLGDSVWWQSDLVMWTPKGVPHNSDPSGCGTRWDIALPKIGYSH